MKTISLTAFMDMLKKTIRENGIKTTQDGSDYYVNVQLWDEGDTVFECMVYTPDENYKGSGATPEVALAQMLAKMTKPVEPVITY